HLGDVVGGGEPADRDAGTTHPDLLPAYRRVERSIGPPPEIVETVGVGGTRTDRVHGDAVWRQLHGEGLREAEDPELRGAVGRQLRVPHLPAVGRDVDDAAPDVALEHRARDPTSAQERPLEV